MPRKNKCFSTCRKRSKSDCSPPECHYTNGKKYKYCRLGYTLKMNSDCIPVLRHAKSSHKNSHTRVRYRPNISPQSSEMELSPDKEQIDAFREKYVKRAATRKISSFLRKTDPRVRTKFLQSVCSDAGICIAFGKQSATIRKHFDDFNNFELLSKPAKSIGGVSSNGFVKELTYTNHGYDANAVLKSSALKTGDNLLYEALVGFALNKFAMYYPSFLETYGLYQYNADGVAYQVCKTNNNTPPDVLSAGLKRIAKKSTDVDAAMIKHACDSPVSMAVLIQHLKGVKTLAQILNSRYIVKYELVYVLFQIYMTLSSLSSVFTHYDLHTENVLVYEPVAGKHIEYHYHLDGEDIIFNSPYIAKIIDYGRCYFNDQENDSVSGNSHKFNIELCNVCKPNCGNRNGFGWLAFDKTRLRNSYHISSRVNNPSHDLRLLSMIGSNVTGMNTSFSKFMKKVVYGKNMMKGDEQYGTKANPVSGVPTKINNVTDAFIELKTLVNHPDRKKDNATNYYTYDKLGELHIYGDGKTPMRYISAEV